jgi:hypothetical protein
MKPNDQKAFDFASETTKQLITLSTAIITLTITFSKDIVGGVSDSSKTYIVWSWGLFIASVFFGIWTLMALAGSLQPMKKKDEQKTDENIQITQGDESKKGVDIDEFSINGFNIRLPSVLQILTFVAALILTVVFGYKSITTASSQTSDKEKGECIEVIKESKYSIPNPTRTDTIYIKK